MKYSFWGIRPGLPLLVIVLFFGSKGWAGEETNLAQVAVRKIFSGNELLSYDISWTGGIKIGELDLAIQATPTLDQYEINARVRACGMFNSIYPVDDSFLTLVGSSLFPWRYEVKQKEGWSRYTKRETIYDQERRYVFYRRDKEDQQIFSLAGPVHNEFSAFLVTRCARFDQSPFFMVPTFADKKRHEVMVRVLGREEVEYSSYGPVQTVRVQPKMTFRGLYNKDGDTVIWLSDDDCRIPVKINSKLLIGSLTARLVAYKNSACSEYNEGTPHWSPRP